jgi:type I restriction enzyme S subunit
LAQVQDFQIALPPLPRQLEIVTKLKTLSAETKRLEAAYERKLVALDDLEKSLLNQAFTGKL